MKVSSGGTEVPGGPETLSSNASPQLPQVTSLMSGPGGSGGRMFLPPSIQSRESGRTGFRSASKPCGAPAERAGQRTSAGVASSLGDPVLPQASCSAAFSAPIPESPAIRGCSPISQRWSASRRMSRAFRQRSVLGFLHGVGEHRHERPEPRVSSAFDAAHRPGVLAVSGLASAKRPAGPAQHPLPQPLQVRLQLGTPLAARIDSSARLACGLLIRVQDAR